MAVNKVVRIYEIPAMSQIEATNTLMEAMILGVEEDYHVVDMIRSPEHAAGKAVKVDLRPPKGWFTLVLDQVLGRDE